MWQPDYSKVKKCKRTPKLKESAMAKLRRCNLNIIICTIACLVYLKLSSSIQQKSNNKIEYHCNGPVVTKIFRAYYGIIFCSN